MKKTVLKIVIAVIGQVIFTLADIDAAGIQQTQPVQLTESSATVVLSTERYEELISYKVLYQEYEKGRITDQDAISLAEANNRNESLLIENDNLKKSLELLNSRHVESVNQKRVITPSLSGGLKYGLPSGYGAYLGASVVFYEHWGGECSVAVSERDLFQVSVGATYQF